MDSPEISVVCSGFMLHAVLAFSTTQVFRISYLGIGPTEIRLGVIALNAWLVHRGFDGMADRLRLAAAIGAVVLLIRVYVTHRTLWRMEMK